MSGDRKAFPLRINGEVYEALRRWADDDLRSVNGQIEFVLRDALVRAGRLGSSNRVRGPAQPEMEEGEP